jgi:hypothetical protein
MLPFVFRLTDLLAVEVNASPQPIQLLIQLFMVELVGAVAHLTLELLHLNQ